MDQPVGFIGTGSMGRPMALHLIDAGFPVIAYDADADALTPLAKKGATIAGSPREVADAAATVFACLPSPSISTEVALGPAGIAGGSAVKVYIETSTIGIPAIERIDGALQQRGIALIDAPVSGGRKGAEARTIAMIVAGPQEPVDSTRPLLAAITDNVFYVGERPGLGQTCKLVNNAISIAGAAIAYEAVVLGVKAGVDAAMLIDVINASSGRNSTTAHKFPQSILPRSFDGGAAIEIAAKDIKLYLEEAERLQVPTWVGSSIGQLWRFAMSQGAGKHDGTSMIRFFEQWAGVEVKGPAIEPD